MPKEPSVFDKSRSDMNSITTFLSVWTNSISIFTNDSFF